MIDLTGPRQRAETTLTGACTITVPGDDRWQGGALVPGTPTTVYAGRCSTSPPSSHRDGTNSGDHRTATAQILRLPVAAGATETGDPGEVAVGHHVAIDGLGEFWVSSIEYRTTQVLRRVLLSRTLDAPGVP